MGWEAVRLELNKWSLLGFSLTHKIDIVLAPEAFLRENRNKQQQNVWIGDPSILVWLFPFWANLVVT